MIKKLFTLIVIFILLLSLFVYSANETANSTKSYQCSDGFDNDGDGFVDYDGKGDSSKKDSGCFGPADDDESGGQSSSSSSSNQNNQQNQTNVSAGGGIDIPWGIIIAAAGPALFLLSGSTKDKTQAAAYSDEKLKDVSNQALASVATSNAPAGLSDLMLISQKTDPTNLVIKGFVGKTTEELIKQFPSIGPMLKVREDIQKLYSEGKIALGKEGNGKEEGHFKVDSNLDVSFKNVEFKGKGTESVDVSSYILNKETLDKKQSINLKGFVADKDGEITTLTVNDDAQVLDIKDSEGKTFRYSNMAKDSVIKLNSKGEIINADIKVGKLEEGKLAQFNFQGNTYSLPEGSSLKYDPKEGVKISNSGKKEVKIVYNKKELNFVSTENSDYVLIKEGKVYGKGNITFSGKDLGKFKIKNLGTKDYSFKIEDNLGIIVENGAISRDGLVLNVEDEKNPVLFANKGISREELEKYQGNYMGLVDIDSKQLKDLQDLNGNRMFIARAKAGSSFKFDVEAGDEIFRVADKSDTKLSFNIQDGAIIQAFSEKQEQGDFIPVATMVPNSGKIEFMNGGRRFYLNKGQVGYISDSDSSLPMRFYSPTLTPNSDWFMVYNRDQEVNVNAPINLETLKLFGAMSISNEESKPVVTVISTQRNPKS